MSKINFSTNVPVTVALREIEGEAVDSKFGGIQYRYRTVEGDTFYLSDTGGALLTARLRSLNLAPGEPVTITKSIVTSIHTGRGTTEWIPRRLEQGLAVAASAIEAAPAERDQLTRQLEASLAEVQRKKAAPAREVRESRDPQSSPGSPVYEALVAQTNALIDAYAAAIKHSSKYEGLVKAEDVRSIFLSAVINNAKSGGYRAA